MQVPQPVVEAPVAEVSGGHPAWQEILSVVPEMLHDKIRPALEKWDTGVQNKLSEVHSQYDAFKPFVEGKVPATDLQAGLELVQLLNSDPKRLYDHMRDFYKFNEAGAASGQGQQQSTEEFDLGSAYGNEEVDLSENPAIRQIREQNEQLMAQFTAQQEAQQAKEADIWITSRQAEISANLATKGITNPDWDYILNRALVESQSTGDYDKALNNAASAFESLVNSYRTPVANASAPPVMSPNGAIPASGPSTPAQLSTDDRKKYLAQMLSAALKDN
jgi:hypothetical protein